MAFCHSSCQSKPGNVKRISSKIKASPKSNRIAVTDFHGTVKRDRLKSPKRNEVSGMEVHLSQPPAPFAEAGNGFNRRLAKVDGTTVLKVNGSPSQ
ncbi:uncharacterized protein LOC144246481 isoform X2 [Lonchura striata]